MTDRWSESLRGQIDLPLRERHLLIVLFSLFLAFPLSLLWSVAAALRAAKRRKVKVDSAQNDFRIISVGNVAVGGTGKSPVVRALARAAISSGFDVAILSRGYGNRDSARQEVLVRINPLNSPSNLDFWNASLADECLEHAVLLASEDLESTSHGADNLPEKSRVWIAQGVNRKLLFECVWEKWSLADKSVRRPLVVLLDDGLSQTSLPVHHDIVLWDPNSVVRSPRASMPFGPYRTGWPGAFWANSLPKADVVVWSRLTQGDSLSNYSHAINAARGVLQDSLPLVSRQWIAEEKVQLAKVKSDPQRPDYFSIEAVSIEQCPKSASVIVGLARPHRFITTLKSLRAQSGMTLELNSIVQLADHGPLDEKARTVLMSPDPVVTSLKDVCRWRSDAAFKCKVQAEHVYVVCLEVDLKDSESGEMSAKIDHLFPSALFRKG